MLDTSDKLTYCRNVLLVELRKERDETKRNMEEALNALKPTADALKKAEKYLEYLRKVEANALATQLLAEGKTQNVEKRAQESEGAVSDLKKEMNQLKASSPQLKKDKAKL